MYEKSIKTSLVKHQHLFLSRVQITLSGRNMHKYVNTYKTINI